jgi:hypothetical protein
MAVAQLERALAGLGWGADARALAAATERLGLRVDGEIRDGGSPARVYQAMGEEPLALKVIAMRPGVVERHDLETFRGKISQLDRIRTLAPALADRYLPVRHYVGGPDWAAYTTPWFESADLAAPLRRRADPGGFYLRHAAVATELYAGYAAASVRTPVDHLARVNLIRFARRYPVLAQALPAGLAAADPIIVNGVRCRPPLAVLAELAGSLRLVRLAPPRLRFCAHGDANTQNVRVGRRGDFRLIDPRGSTEHWDPVSDLARTLVSLTVRDPALRLGFTVEGGPAYRVSFRRPVWPGYRAAAHGFADHAYRVDTVAGLLAGDPAWRERLLLTHDLHVLAEAPARLADLKPRIDQRGAPISAPSLALGHFLLGTLLLNDLASQLAGGEVDVDRHLRLVTGGPATSRTRRSR